MERTAGCFKNKVNLNYQATISWKMDPLDQQ